MEDLDALFDEMLAGPKAAPAPDKDLGQDARRTLRRQRSLELGIHPVTQALLHPEAAPAGDRAADGLRCADCAHCLSLGYHNKTYVKCGVDDLTHGPGTDTRRWYPACTRYTPEEDR